MNFFLNESNFQEPFQEALGPAPENLPENPTSGNLFMNKDHDLK